MRSSSIKSMRETAIQWFMRMQHANADHTDRSRFEAWLMSHPAHQRAYSEVAELWEDFDSPSQVQLLASAMEQKERLKEERKNRIKKSIASTLGVLMIAVASLLGYQIWQAQPLMQIATVTDVGQIKSQELEDGTKLTINSGSEIEIIYYRNQRLVKLYRGEAIFEVTRDESRPFVVDSGKAKITVLGTRFAVNRLQSLVRISVDHGSVKVESQSTQGNANGAPLILKGGDVAQIDNSGVAKRIDFNAADSFEFQQGIITFDQAGLEEIAETLSRHRRPMVHADVTSGHDVHITAVLNVKNVEKFLYNLPTMAPVIIHSEAGNTVLLGQPAHQKNQ